LRAVSNSRLEGRPFKIRCMRFTGNVMRFQPGCGLVFVWLLASACSSFAQSAIVQKTATFSPGKFPTFTFQELLDLSKDEPLSAGLDAKLSSVLHSAVLDNSYTGKPSTRIQLKTAGPALRVAEWNIERGENFDWVVLALNDSKRLRTLAHKDDPKISTAALDKATAEAKNLSQSDILILNEVDWGMGRSGYRDVARALASALHMNYVYGVEFAEVDPLKLGTDQLTAEDVGNDEELEKELNAELRADATRYKGLHGSAILSRYPISNVSVLRLPVCHDWFGEEVHSVSKIEQGKRLGSDKIFLEKIEREIRRGGRIAILADLKISDIPGGTLTVVDAHLENKCTPECRRKQLDAILDSIEGVKTPLVLAGDLNTTGADASHLSVAYIAKSKVKDYRFWLQQAVMWGTPLPSTFALNYFKNFNDPSAMDIKVLGNNKEAALFNLLERFRFDDGGRFDFRGDPLRTLNGKGGRLSDSNQRARKGFVYTFALPRSFKGLVGRYRLDWLFVKPAYDDRRLTDALAPWQPRTMIDLNAVPSEKISDHAPITVDLPVRPTKNQRRSAP
jgi:endonuclease/exonuclease/phosphatase family metal-dependent hydrolase